MAAVVRDAQLGALMRERPVRVRSRAGRHAGWLLLLDLLAGLLAAEAVAGTGLVTALPLAAGWAVLLLFSASSASVARAAPRGVWRGATVVGLACWGLGPHLGVPPMRLLLATGVLLVVSVSGRLVRGGRGRLRVLVVAEEGDTAFAGLEEVSAGRLRVVGRCRPRPAEVAVRVVAEPVDAVLAVPGPTLAGRSLQRLAWEVEAAGVPLLVATRLDGVAAARVGPMSAGALGLVQVRWAGRRGWRGALKRYGERLAAALGLLVLAPLLAVVAVAIRLDSPGPAIFRQTRVGRGGVPFTILKFRTMCQDAESMTAELASDGNGVLFKMRQDPRVTRVGQVLRRYSIDELPQLINVVRGEMALVGPRPALPSEEAVFDGDPVRRLAVAPGITGLWQVSGRSDLSWSESVRLDLDYVDNWSLGLDLMILARTVGAVFRHSGAY
jgi:exopolysaccharide biosynthesis polyprenyl glycosylphosphotransferase